MTQNICERLRRSISRTKVVDIGLEDTTLRRCLSTTDLVFIGIGSMVGSGVYILTGEVVAKMAGPAATLSFLIAGLMCLLTSLLFTECATRFTQTGASYLFTYVSLGELMAFLVGWNVIIFRVLVVAYTSRGLSAYFDDIIDDKVKNLTVEYLLGGMEWDFPAVLVNYPDIIGGVIALLASITVALGTDLSAKTNAFFVLVNIVTIALVFVFAMIHADFSYLTKYSYFPMGFSGVLSGVVAFFGSGYGGFEAIVFSSEEAKNPSIGLPVGIISAFSFSILNYIAGVLAITVLSDYQNINPTSPFVTAFRGIGLNWMKYVVGLGGICSISGSVLISVFCLSRNIFAMARDGLIPTFLARTNERTNTPIIATLFGGILSVVISIFIDFGFILQFMSLGVFADYIIVSIAVILLRYRSPISSEYMPITTDTELKNIGSPDDDMTDDGYPREIADTAGKPCNNSSSGKEKDRSLTLSKPTVQSLLWRVSSCFSVPKQLTSEHPTTLILVSLSFHLLFEFIAVALVTYKMDELWVMDGSIVFGVVSSSAIAIVSCWPLLVLPQYSEGLSFKLPLMPYLPLVSLLFNVILAVQIDPLAWIEFFVSLATGVIVYFVYGIHHSLENKNQ